MFITFDGSSGSGKTTLMKILVERLKLETVDAWNKFEAFHSISRVIGNSNVYARVLAHLQVVVHTPLSKHSIVEHFWQPYFSLYWADPDTFTKAIRFCRMSMNYFGQREPDVSIMLDVPFKISQIRRIERFTNASVKVSHKKTRDPNRDKQMQLYKILESELPYFHVVDATGSINETMNTIIELLPISTHEVLKEGLQHN